MAEAHRGIRTHEIEIATAADIGDPRALAVREHDRQRVVVARAESLFPLDERGGGNRGGNDAPTEVATGAATKRCRSDAES